MRDSRRTSLLLTAAAALILVHFFPVLATPIAWLALSAGLLWMSVAAVRLFVFYRDRSSRAAEQAADEQEYRSYKTALDALRAQHDPNHEWNESTDYPKTYRDSLSVLHERHRAMLERRFGSG